MERVSQEHLDKISKTQATVRRLWANENKKRITNIDLSEQELSELVDSYLQKKAIKPGIETFNSLVSDIEISQRNKQKEGDYRNCTRTIQQGIMVERSRIKSKLLGKVETTIQKITNNITIILTPNEETQLRQLIQEGQSEKDALKTILPPKYYKTIITELNNREQITRNSLKSTQ